ncbi:hypothetical protein MML61_21110 [Mycobacterium marinum]|nr:hypothetical protein [Mycobacterium marinum]WCS17306.1 hypothetical protein MML61_21110 [Mycobacterium marinum]
MLAVPGAGLARVALLVMAVWVASAGVVVAVVMGLVVWGMSLPVVLAVMGVSVARPARAVRRPVVVAHGRVRGGRRQRRLGGMVVPGTRVRMRAPRAVPGARLGWRCGR